MTGGDRAGPQGRGIRTCHDEQGDHAKNGAQHDTYETHEDQHSEAIAPFGRASRALARAGASVVGVDLSGELIAAGRQHEAEDGLGIRYHVADIADLDRWWDGVAFDAAICEMAMMDIDDLSSTVTAVATVVGPGGSFVISMVHPCFPGNDAGLSSWPPGGSYTDEGWWTSTAHNPDGARIRVGSSHRTVSTYVNALIAAGFSINRMLEPAAPVPTFLLLRCRRLLDGEPSINAAEHRAR